MFCLFFGSLVFFLGLVGFGLGFGTTAANSGGSVELSIAVSASFAVLDFVYRFGLVWCDFSCLFFSRQTLEPTGTHSLFIWRVCSVPARVPMIHAPLLHLVLFFFFAYLVVAAGEHHVPGKTEPSGECVPGHNTSLCTSIFFFFDPDPSALALVTPVPPHFHLLTMCLLIYRRMY